MNDRHDLVAIGAGPAGESAAELAAFFGHRSDGAPTKTLREAALYFSGFCEKDIYGLRMSAAPEIAIDFIREHTRNVCKLLQLETGKNIADSDVDYIHGTARLSRDGGIIVTGEDGEKHHLHPNIVLIATGSRPSRPTNVPFDIPDICDTDTILSRGRVPKSIVIVGAGPVGVEFATICHVLGAKVTLLDRGSRLLSTMDDEIAEHLEGLFENWESRSQAGRGSLHCGYRFRDRRYRADVDRLRRNHEHSRKHVHGYSDLQLCVQIRRLR